MFYPISTSYEWFVPVTIYIHYSCWKINLFLFCKKNSAIYSVRHSYLRSQTVCISVSLKYLAELMTE